jgi:16S rRNA (cytosine1402-N4)-methyltransferase
MLDESIQNLNIRPDGVYIDGTLGGGGHTSEILARLTTGRLIAFDKDQDAIDYCKTKLKDYTDKITYIHDDFKSFAKHLDTLGIDHVDGILLDLGVSSYQIDNADRGFSYMNDAPLDMRMNVDQQKDAWEIVNHYTEDHLTKIFSNYGQEPYSKRIAHAIILARKNGNIDTTKQLVDVIQSVIPHDSKKQGHPAKRVFQALRIEVNGELDKLYDCVVDMTRHLSSGGRICILTFHSLEDKLVKDAFNMLTSDCICDKKMPICVCHHKKEATLVTKKPILASEQEQQNNPRSHSAKLRVLQKI